MLLLLVLSFQIRHKWRKAPKPTLKHNQCGSWIKTNFHHGTWAVSVRNFGNFLQFLRNSLRSWVQLPIQFSTKFFLLNFCFTPPQSTFLLQSNKNQKNSHKSATAHVRCKKNFLKKQNTQVPISYPNITSVKLLNFFKLNQENRFFY